MSPPARTVSASPRILIEGRPGTGKTTVARRLAALLDERGIPTSGFVTGELREGRKRVGFLVEALGGERAELAHVNLPGPPRVGKYGVDLEAFERLALPALESVPERGVVIIDELGKMELASERFRAAFTKLMERRVPIVATAHAYRHRFTDPLKDDPGVEVVRLTTGDRDRLPRRLADRLAKELG